MIKDLIIYLYAFILHLFKVVAFALLCVDRGAGEEARAPLQALAPVHLAEIVLQFYDFLLDEAGGSEPTFSEFAILLRDTGVNFINILCTNFSYERCFGSFFLVTCS